MRGDDFFRIRKNTNFFLSRRHGGTRRPPDLGRPRSGGSLFSLFFSLCDLRDLERSGREIKVFSGASATALAVLR